MHSKLLIAVAAHSLPGYTILAMYVTARIIDTWRMPQSQATALAAVVLLATLLLLVAGLCGHGPCASDDMLSNAMSAQSDGTLPLAGELSPHCIQACGGLLIPPLAIIALPALATRVARSRSATHLHAGSPPLLPPPRLR